MSKSGTKRKEDVALAPGHPTPVRAHRLFGASYLEQHMMIDNLWTVDAIADAYKNMCSLFASRNYFKRLEFNANRKRYNHENSLLRRQCREGRAKLQMTMIEENDAKVRNILMNHTDLQRLYQHKPLHATAENMFERTFVLRKEKDRLLHRLEQLKETYREALLKRADLETQIKYQDDYVLDTEIQARIFRKKIEASNIRLRANQTISSTYTKMIQVLRHDALFYEPIITSLIKDIDDQTNFIKHVLHIGIPAISCFKDLDIEFRNMESKTNKLKQERIQFIENFKNETKTTYRRMKSHTYSTKQRYVRETRSMRVLQIELEVIEKELKTVKFATLCAQVTDIFPRMKSQIEDNRKLRKAIENDIIGYQSIRTKMRYAKVFDEVLVHNLSEEESLRMERIQDLQKKLDDEYQFQEDTIKYMKNRADVYVILRFTLWNLSEILRYVGRKLRPPAMKYPNSYLKLPLLKFEMLTMNAYPPEIYEENFNTLMQVVERKVRALMEFYPIDLSAEKSADCIEQYHTTFLDAMDLEVLEGSIVEIQGVAEGDDVATSDVKVLLSDKVPTRKYIKEESARIVEEFSRKED